MFALSTQKDWIADSSQRTADYYHSPIVLCLNPMYNCLDSVAVVREQEWDGPQPLFTLEPIAYVATVVYSKEHSSSVSQVLQVE